jgi:hypothetical protein
VLDHKRHDLGDVVSHLVAERLRILTAASLPTTAAGGGNVGDHLLALLRGEKVAARPGMALLATAIAARAFALPLAARLKTAGVTGWRLPLRARPSVYEEFLELRPFCSSSWATRLERVSSWMISWSTSALTVGGVASQSLSEIPAGGGSISGSLCLRSKLFSGLCQERS